MKANAAAAISARLAAQLKAEKERLNEQRAKLLASKRQRSEPDMLAAQQRLIAEAGQEQDGSENDEDYEDVDDDTAAGEEEEDDDAWSSATDESAKGAGLVIGKAKPKPKRDPAAIAAAKALAAEEDAKRKRELFAKRAIFGTGGMSGLSTVTRVAPRANSPGEVNPANATGASKPGLLTNLFERQRDVLRRGDSMVSLVEPSHSVPPRVHATEGTRQREGMTPNLGFSFMNRSKSSAALPIASGISVTTSGLINSSHSLEPVQDTETKTTPIRGKLRLPPKPDEDADFSPSSSPDNTSSMLATSEAVRRLEALSTKRRSSARSNLSQETTEPAVLKSPAEAQETAPMASALTTALERTQSHPMPVQQHSVQFVEPAMPQTPTTRRRQMLATELPEDLRMNLLFERKSRASVYPKSNLRATASVHDLPEAGRESEFSSTEMSRQTSHNPSDEVASKREVSPNSAAQPPARRRSGPNLLSGGNLLRPLTSASTANVVRGQSEANTQQESSQPAVRQPLQRDQRSKSSANVSDLSRVDAHRGIGFGGWGGPDFKRRSTEGDNRDASAAEQRLARLKALREREGELSSSFRSHGW
ncbi:hypothetical protein QFC20_007721 [Naganishia adeliensis]|uniref:Uncharacterized protein n=1 Tax=Naganishia adeliensis TaxID=92952 RepID=A0ACC2UVZ4_9TREE|nr:hypothetical protein QFC20_007721 [Naganishia adeliensis]